MAFEHQKSSSCLGVEHAKKGFNSLIMDGVSENDGIWYTSKQIQILWTMTTNDKPLDLGVEYPILKQPKTRFLMVNYNGFYT